MNRSEREKAGEKLLKKICRKTGVTLREHQMIGSDDHLLIGLSGGKDSMVLAEIMAERRDALPFSFKITAAHIDITNIGYATDREALAEFCKSLDIEFIYQPSIVDLGSDQKKSVCFVCSWNRRKRLFGLANELQCNKLALGHHRNDAVETMLMNMIYHGSLSSMPYTLRMFNGELTLLRPLLDMDENLLKEYAALRNYHFEKAGCPYESHNKRDDVRELMNQIRQQHSKGIYHMFGSMDKIFTEYLPQKKSRDFGD